MVKSRVALWHVDEVGGLSNLIPILEELSETTINPPPDAALGALAEALIDAGSLAPVWSDLDSWAGVIAILWSRLWPNARQRFSARVAVSLPQAGDSVDPPWIYGVPAERVNQWTDRVIVGPQSRPLQISRAARWLMGESDATLSELLNVVDLGSSPGVLRRLALASDRLDAVRANPNAQSALRLLRTLIEMAPRAEADTLKGEALQVLSGQLRNAPASVVLSLGNIPVQGLPAQPPKKALGRWLKQHATSFSPKGVTAWLERLSADRAEDWWQQEVKLALRNGMEESGALWISATVRWLAFVEPPHLLAEVISASEALESRVIAAANEFDMPPDAVSRLVEHAKDRGWSRLHAWAVCRCCPPREALARQAEFGPDPIPGLRYATQILDGNVVIDFAVTSGDQEILELAAERTSRDPGLLSQLSADRPAWRALWACHIHKSGMLWPPGADRDTLGQALFSAVAAGDPCDVLIGHLARDLGDVALDHQNQTQLWSQLGPKARAGLANSAGEALNRRIAEGRVPETPTDEVLDRLTKIVRQNPSAFHVAVVLDWDGGFTEDELVGWIERRRLTGWIGAADKLGRSVLRQRWARATRALYMRRNWRPEVRPAVFAAKDLLSWWERYLLSWDRAGAIDRQAVVHRVADLGADLCPSGLEHVWERAGGSRRSLPDDRTPARRWQRAAEVADRGALEKGLGGLVEQLVVEFPHNTQLQEIVALLAEERKLKR